MPKTLTSTINAQVSDQELKPIFIFKINDLVRSTYVINWAISFNVKFGAASAQFTLDNSDETLSDDGTNDIDVGDKVEFIEQFGGDATQWKSFYGVVAKRSISKRAGVRTITLSCLDYISVLQGLDIDLAVEGDRVEVIEEILSPTYLASPNDDLAQLFNFTSSNVATKPIPLIKIQDKNHTNILEPQYDGYEIYYDVGQLKLGSALNVAENYNLLATYSYYVKGVYVEDVIEAILTKVDGYGNYLFGEPSAQSVIDNHLTTTYQAEEGAGFTDTLTTNIVATTLTIETTLASDVTLGNSSVILVDATGFPTSGSGTINGDAFTWAGKSSNTLTGIPTSGANSLKAHNSGDYVKYETEYAAGRVWSTRYDNVTTTLASGDFTIGGGGTFSYFDKRFGRLFLTSAISVASTVTCDTNYSFKTLQATGIEVNRIVFRPRETKNRLEAIKKVKQYVAPNYLIRTQGDNKIWTSYLNQKSTADYTLNLVTGLNYLEDEDLYTRVKMWAKNKQPTNIMFGNDVDYSSDTESDYTGIATKHELRYFGEEKSGVSSEWASDSMDSPLDNIIADVVFVKKFYIDKDYGNQPSTGKHIFGTPISDEQGRIILGDITPIVYINNVPINNTIQQQVAVPLKIKAKVETITEGGGKSKSVSTTVLYYYTVIFAHSSIVPDDPIYLYDNQGILRHTLAANDPNMDYARGIWTIPGIEQNDVNEILSTATYQVLYSTDDIEIDYENVIFKISKSILPDPTAALVTATFEYWTIAVGIRDISKIVDGRRDTQFQLEFFGEPPLGFHLATVDLGTSYSLQAIDLVGGFFKPDNLRKFDMRFSVSMEYSTDGTNFYAISDKTDNFEITSGEVVSFEEEDLGIGLEARYLKFTLQDVDKIDYGKGRYVVAMTQLSIYNNIVLESEATLIPTSTLTGNVTDASTSITVSDISAFTSTGTAYIDKDSTKSFTYTGIESGGTFTGCTVASGVTGSIGEYVSQAIVSDTTIYDNEELLSQLGDRLYKKQMISDRNLYLQADLDDLAKDYLKEFYKNHSKISVNILYAPYLKIGNTVSLTDSYNNVSNRMYFIESVGNRGGNYSITLARYP